MHGHARACTGVLGACWGRAGAYTVYTVRILYFTPFILYFAAFYCIIESYTLLYSFIPARGSAGSRLGRLAARPQAPLLSPEGGIYRNYAGVDHDPQRRGTARGGRRVPFSQQLREETSGFPWQPK